MPSFMRCKVNTIRRKPKMKNKKQASWKTVFRMNHRALTVFYRRYPGAVISRFCSVIWNSLTPYVGIYLSALVIEELAGERNAARLQMLVLVNLLAAAVVALGSTLFEKWKGTQNAGIMLKMEHICAEKLFGMDYVDVDSTQTAEYLSAIRQNYSVGWGLYRVILGYEELCSALFTLLGGISLTITLFTSRVPETAGTYTLLNHPIFVVIIIGVMLAITYLAPVLANKGERYWAISAGNLQLANRLFGFYGFRGHQREIATDMRIYRQDRICALCFRENKAKTFGSKSLMAKYGRGPMGLYKAGSAAVSMIFTGVVYGFVCLKALGGAFGLGAVTQYVASITKVSVGVANMVSAWGSMQNNTAFLEPVFAFLDIPNKMYQGSLTVEKRRDRKYHVEFRNVSFCYPGSDTYALRNVNMKFEIGKRLAVVGMNGSGKTTFIKLLCRLYDPTEGEILLNGIDIRKYNYREYMDIFSVVFQDFRLLGLKLGENVASRVDYDRERVLDCLEKAGFSERLAELTDGIDTYLYKDFAADGVDLSGGEAQKVAIARALYKDAPFIILDEPTAALDPIAEAEIYSRFDEIAGDKTAIYISHRLSSCKFCDEIMVFHEGEVIQQGTHAALLGDTNGKYY
ncbi:MAG: ABC transporter ATP-binding protein, partial [Clostridia bacterium]|nr:ABC transporter ATP-binding protein [Clostridia bacterium]